MCFMCPYSKDIRHSKSFVAYKLQEGISYTQFLGLKPQKSARRSLRLAEDECVVPTLALPEELGKIELPKTIHKTHKYTKPSGNMHQHGHITDACTTTDSNSCYRPHVRGGHGGSGH